MANVSCVKSGTKLHILKGSTTVWCGRRVDMTDPLISWPEDDTKKNVCKTCWKSWRVWKKP